MTPRGEKIMRARNPSSARDTYRERPEAFRRERDDGVPSWTPRSWGGGSQRSQRSGGDGGGGGGGEAARPRPAEGRDEQGEKPGEVDAGADRGAGMI
jgi:hypothetical protein